MLLTLKALHIIGVVVWFSGLFYIGRLFVYHKEAEEKPETERKILQAQFALMEKRLWYAITGPGMVVTLVMGLALIYYFALPAWLMVKIFLVFILLGYHWLCGHIRKQLAEGECSWTGNQLRMFNEVPSLLLITIVFVVVLKSQLSWPLFSIVLIGLIIVIGGTVQFYAKLRKREQSSVSEKLEKGEEPNTKEQS